MRFLSKVLFACMLVCVFIVSTQSKLVSVQLLSRHGNRCADPVVLQLCPNAKEHLDRYEKMGIVPSGLTPVGMKEIYEMGLFTRQNYILKEKLIPNQFIETDVFIRAVGETRTIQSGAVFAQALYPHSPQTYFASLPSPVPIYVVPDKIDYLLEVRKGGCKERLKREIAEYDANESAKMWASPEGAQVIKEVGEICGADMYKSWVGSHDNLYTSMKDVTDAFFFDQYEGFEFMPGLTEEKLLRFRTLAVRQLLGRICGDDEKITYMSGDLPTQILKNFNQSRKGGQKLIAYHSHREMMYAIAKFLGINYDINAPGLPKGAIPPGTTIFIELHQYDDIEHKHTNTNTNTNTTINSIDDDNNYFVRTYVWIPCHKEIDINSIENNTDIDINTNTNTNINIDCPATLYTIDNCEQDCPLTKYKSLIHERIHKTGSWQSLCNYQSPEQLKQSIQSLNLLYEDALYTHKLYSAGMFGCACIAIVFALLYYLTHRRLHNQYHVIRTVEDEL